MSKLQHTPGPWFATRFADGVYGITFEYGGDLKVELVGTNENQEVNARLIASAPDLLIERDRLKKEVEELKEVELLSERLYALAERDRNTLQAVNAELLEASEYVTYAAAGLKPLDEEYISITITGKGLNDLREAIAKATANDSEDSPTGSGESKYF